MKSVLITALILAAPVFLFSDGFALTSPTGVVGVVAENQQADTGFEDDFPSGDFESDSFDNDAPENPGTGSGTNPKLSFLDPGGYLKFSSSYNTAHHRPEPGDTDWRGLSSFRSELFLELDGRLPHGWKIKVSGFGLFDGAYCINGRDDYTDEVLDHYEHELELKDTYLQGRLTDKLDLKAGRQIVVWGKSDSLRLTDILNPENLREPGKTDLEDRRLPVWMTKLDCYEGDWSFTAIAVHEHRWNKLPEYGSDFYSSDTPLPPEETPTENLENTEYAVSVKGIFTGWDFALYYADYYEDTPYLKFLSGSPGSFVLRHAHQQMIGADVNLARGDFLFKAEAAFFKGVRFSDSVDTGTDPPGIHSVPDSYSKTAILAGIEYTGFTDTMITVETMNTHIHGHDRSAKNAGADEDLMVTSIRIQRDFLNEQLTLESLSILYGDKSRDGGIHRFSAVYDVTDDLTVRTGYMLYDSGDLPVFQSIGENDRIFLDIKYSF
ncbi:MAG: hypothetical protein GY737_01115 [Desulfobacteraceae bacterium]|nr:hypothetical protein [Desulfobacteraceae bacterium]